MSLISLGREQENHVEPATPGSTKKIVMRYPSFTVNDIELPVSSKDVGKIVTAVVKLRVNRAGLEIDEYRDNKKRQRSEFSVMGIDLVKKKVDVKNMSASDLDDAERAEHDHMSK